jgi:hypothetical protein
MLIHCLDQFGIQIEVTKQGGRVPLKPAKGAPYGYTATCPESGLEFQAAPGVDLTIRATSPRHPMPAGELVLMCYWKNNVKDKMVGIMLDEDLWRISRITAPIGLILILCGAALQSIRKISGRRNSA